MIKKLIKKIRKNFKVVTPWFLFGLSLTIVIFLSIELFSTKENTNKFNENDVNSIISKVGKLIILPKDETPTIATITDLNALKEAYKGGAFFANAKVGYKVLIYMKSGTAILYDPIENKIVESGPVDSRPK